MLKKMFMSLETVIQKMSQLSMSNQNSIAKPVLKIGYSVPLYRREQLWEILLSNG